MVSGRNPGASGGPRAGDDHGEFPRERTPSVDRAQRRGDALVRLAVGLSEARSADDIGAIVTDLAPGAVGADSCTVGYLDPDEERIVLLGRAAAAGPEAEGLTSPSGPLALAIRSGTAVLSQHEADSPRPPAPTGGEEGDARARLAAYPLDVAPGQPQAAIVCAWPEASGRERDAAVAPAVALCAAALTRAWAVERSARLASIMDAVVTQSPLGIAFLDRRQRFVFLNEALAEMNGLRLADHLGRSLREVVPNLADAAEPVFRQVLATAVPSARFELSGATAAAPEDQHIWEEWFVPVTDASGEIIGVLAIVEDITERRRSREQLQRQYDRERRIAARLQRALRPRGLPPLIGYDVAARYLPGSDSLRIGGDWYDLRDLGSGRFAVLIGDVVGHDLSAALTMNELRDVLSGIAHLLDDPGAILDHLDGYVSREEGGTFVATLFYGVLDPPTGSLTYCCAGHPPPLLVPARGAPTFLEGSSSAPIGMGQKPRPIGRTLVHPGTALVMYTDGLVESRERPAEAGMRHLAAVAAEPEPQLEAYADRLLEEVPPPGSSDDIALLIIRRAPA